MIQGTSLPQYLDEVTLSVSQEKFFTDKVIECARGTQYLFEDVNKSKTPVMCSEILNNPTLNFVNNSRELAEHFLVSHPNTASSGVLIITRVTMVINTVAKSFIAILKVDYTKVLQQVRDKKNPKLMTFKEIVDSLSEDKSAIQKRVLVDVGNNFKWDVLAVERGRVGQKQDTNSAITDYFKKFLSVKLRENYSV
jgi:3-oxoacyl-ACP reductase-like protein